MKIAIGNDHAGPEYKKAIINLLTSKNIIVNNEYQRSNKVWPASARSYLIDTILNGFPMPKLSLYQKTDLKQRETRNEIVGGQQRSQAILDFYNDKLRISGPSAFKGKRFSDLDEEHQVAFIEYQLDVDKCIAATDDEVRQMFRRINSYTVPLNPEEKRHSEYQGAFKWFVIEVTERYVSLLKDIGVFTENNLRIHNIHDNDPLQSYLDFCDVDDEDILAILDLEEYDD